MLTKSLRADLPSSYLSPSTALFIVDPPPQPESAVSMGSQRSNEPEASDFLVSTWSSRVHGPPATSVSVFHARSSKDGESPPATSPSSEELNKEEHIPRPMNSWMLFRADWTARHKNQQKGNLSARAAVEWRDLSNAERAVWIHKAELVKEQHARMYPDYKYKPGRNKGHSGTSPTSTAGKSSSTRPRSHSHRVTASAAVPASLAKPGNPSQERRTKAQAEGSVHSRSGSPSSSSASAPSCSGETSQAADLSAFKVPMSIPPPPVHDLASDPSQPTPLYTVAKPLRFAAPTPTYSLVIPEAPDHFVAPSHYGSDGSASYESLPSTSNAYETWGPRPSPTYTFPPQHSSFDSTPHPHHSPEHLTLAPRTYYEAPTPSGPPSAPFLPSTTQGAAVGPSRRNITRMRSFPSPYQSSTSSSGSRAAAVPTRDPPMQRLWHPWENTSTFVGAPGSSIQCDASGQACLSEPTSFDSPVFMGGTFDDTLPAPSFYHEPQQPEAQTYMPFIPEHQPTPFGQQVHYTLEAGSSLQPGAPYSLDRSSSPSSTSSASFGAGSLATTSSFGSSSSFRPHLPSLPLSADAFLENAGIDLHILGGYAPLTGSSDSSLERGGSEIVLSVDTTSQFMNAALTAVEDSLNEANHYSTWAQFHAASEHAS
ncbi:hypothetical protein FRC04_006482 [Tulasnella sp. 424]|nr:hypothetical protein FRC04_006482 [Tulasnella sp. 424]KAG8980528.1 hypothetical protein FRC05_006161 [Tulasnella sp. 425]